MNLSSLATNAFATTRSTFKGLAEAAVATGEDAGAAAPARVVAEQAAAPTAEMTAETRPKGVRLGTVLDAYA